jgi:uncharacterized membrane protein YuzA (DUF378 family)
MEILWVLFLFILHFVGPVITVIALVWGAFKLRSLYRDIRSIRASRGNATAMDLELTRLKSRFAMIGAVMLGIVGFFAGFYVTVWILGLSTPNIAIVFAAVFFAPLAIRSRLLKQRYNNSFKENFVTIELSKVFSNLKYKPNEYFSGDEIRGLNFFSRTDGISGNDFIEADYKGLRFSQSDLEVSEIWTDLESDKNGDTREVTHSLTVFGGRVMKFDFADAFRGEVQVVGKSFDGARVRDESAGWQSVETELAEFGERFNVFARDPLDAMAALTPQMIEGIHYLERAVHKPLSLYFKGNSMYAFLEIGHDSFEIGAGKKTLLEASEMLTRDIALVTDFLETMYFKRQEGGDAAIGVESLPRRREIPAAGPSLEDLTEDLTRKGRRVFSFAISIVWWAVVAIYAVSAIYTFVMLPDGIVLSSNVTNPDAVTAPTLVYLAVLTVFVLGFIFPLLGRQGRINIRSITGSIMCLAGTSLLLLFHWLFVSANIGG